MQPFDLIGHELDLDLAPRQGDFGMVSLFFRDRTDFVCKVQRFFEVFEINRTVRE